jgi:tight adherence protein B
MGLIVFIVFVGVFSILALTLIGSSASSARRNKQTIAVLDAALASDKQALGDQVIDVRKSDEFSAVPWVNQWLLKIELAPRLRNTLYQSGLKWTVGKLVTMSVLIAIVVQYATYLKFHIFFLTLLIGLGAGCLPFLFVLFKRKKRFDKFEEGMPEAVDLMVSALRGGQSLASALGMVGTESPEPIGSEFRLCFEEQNYGLELRVALDHLTTRMPLQDLKIIIAAILIQKESGGNLAEVLDKTSHVIRERFRLRREVRTYTAQGRLTGWVLTLLPVILGIALFCISPDHMSLLWKRDLGIKLLYGSAILTFLGALVIRKIVNFEI